MPFIFFSSLNLPEAYSIKIEKSRHRPNKNSPAFSEAVFYIFLDLLPKDLEHLGAADRAGAGHGAADGAAFSGHFYLGGRIHYPFGLALYAIALVLGGRRFDRHARSRFIHIYNKMN